MATKKKDHNSNRGWCHIGMIGNVSLSLNLTASGVGLGVKTAPDEEGLEVWDMKHDRLLGVLRKRAGAIEWVPTITTGAGAEQRMH